MRGQPIGRKDKTKKKLFLIKFLPKNLSKISFFLKKRLFSRIKLNVPTIQKFSLNFHFNFEKYLRCPLMDIKDSLECFKIFDFDEYSNV